MKNTFLLSLFAAICLMAISSCEKTGNTATSPEIILSNPPADSCFITAGPEGGQYTVTYSVKNPVEGSELYASAEKEWIHGFEYEYGKVSFIIDENEEQAGRTNILRLFYEKAEVVEIPVSQLASQGPTFEFQLRDMTSTGVTIDVLPSDKTIYYTWNILDKALADEKYADDDALTAYAIEVMNQDLEDYKNYVDQNGSLVDILSHADDLYRVNVLDPGSDYQLFAFGVDEKSGMRNTVISRHDFSTPEFKVADACKFDITFDEVLQTEMTFTISPDNPSTRYYVGLCPAKLIEIEGADEVALQLIRQADIAGIDWAAYSSLHSGEKTVNTFSDMNITDLTPGQSYAIVVFGVSSLGERTTEVSYAVQALPLVQPSDMTFEISLVEQTSGGAILSIVPSVKNEPYIAGCMQYEQYAEYIGRDGEFMEYIVEYGGMGVYEGDYLMDKSNALIADTDYICFAFGYSGGVTTPLSVFEFRTGKPDTGSDAAVEFVEIRIIDGSQVGYDGKAAVYAYLEPNENAVHWYGQVLSSVDGVCTDLFGNPFTDTELIGLLTDPHNDSKYTDSEYVATPIDWGAEITFFAIAEDADGNLGPMVKKTVVPREEDMTEQGGK